MTDKKLRRLRRAALIELLIEQMEKNERLEALLDEANEQLNNREITIENAGSIAEASLALNHMFASAEAAAVQYLDNIKMTNARSEEIIENAEQEAARIIREAQQKAQEIHTVDASADESNEPELPRAPSASRASMEQRFDEVFAQMRRRNK